jgi:uncharacterized protein
MPAPTRDDRLRVRQRPAGSPVMHQSWQELLFLHWDFSVEEVQATLPPGLMVDSWNGRAWVGVVPFRMRGIRPRGCPAVPGISNFLELNLRTYVHDDRGTPGVWFYSLDANQRLAVWVARRLFHLNYRYARMESIRDERTGWIDYRSLRQGVSPGFECRFRYRSAGPSAPANPESLEFFLVERYVLFSRTPQGALYTGTVVHDPYQISPVELAQWSDGLFPLQGLPKPNREPVHAVMSRGVDVDVYGLMQHSG